MTGEVGLGSPAVAGYELLVRTRRMQPKTRNIKLYFFIQGGNFISPIAIFLGKTTTLFPACH
jgi:hypothetical protein